MENNFDILESTWVSKSSLYCDFSLRPPITGHIILTAARLMRQFFLDSKKALILLITRSCCQNSMHIRFRGLGCASNQARSFLNGRNQKCFANTPLKQVTHDRRNPLVCTLIVQLILECTDQVVSLKDCVWFWSFETCSRLFSNHGVAVYF